MKPQPKAEAERWLRQARSDLAFAEVGVREGLARHPALADLRDAAQRLDQYYVPTRYPNGLPAGTPADVFSKAQASEAVAHARRLVEAAAGLIG
jgi:HEPN domain-containing protein